jgi:hypothetical protein
MKKELQDRYKGYFSWYLQQKIEGEAPTNGVEQQKAHV